MDVGFEPGSFERDYGSATTKPCVILLEYYGVDLIYLELHRLNSKNSKKFGFFCLISRFSGGARDSRLPAGNQIYRLVTKTLPPISPMPTLNFAFVSCLAIFQSFIVSPNAYQLMLIIFHVVKTSFC
jgi:hypothetical protein